MLVGLSGVGIPILIHLLNRYRHRELDWAAMELLRRALERDYEPQREADPLTEDVDVFLLPDDVARRVMAIAKRAASPRLLLLLAEEGWPIDVERPTLDELEELISLASIST